MLDDDDSRVISIYIKLYLYKNIKYYMKSI